MSASLQGTEYCYVKIDVGGERAADVLRDALPGIVSRLSFGRSMRWMPHSDIAFSRPVRWLLALHGDVAVPVALGSLQSAPHTRLLRQSECPTAHVASAADYPQVMASAGIVLGQDERRAQIWRAVQAAAAVWSSSCVHLQSGRSAHARACVVCTERCYCCDHLH